MLTFPGAKVRILTGEFIRVSGPKVLPIRPTGSGSDQAMKTDHSIYKVAIILLLVATAGAQSIPDHAHKNSFGSGWECNRGFVQAGNESVSVDIPTNAKLNYWGHGWECERGYVQSGNQCLPVVAPANAKLNYWGHGWECNRGYVQSGGECLPLRTPQNASVNYSGHDWQCNRGYIRSGNECLPVALPENASLDYSGHGWRCNRGYVRREMHCVPLALASDDEIRQLMISESVSSYPGSCPCPYFVDRAGRSCGRRSAYSRPGGYSPLCYPSDISPAAVADYREKR